MQISMSSSLHSLPSPAQALVSNFNSPIKLKQACYPSRFASVYALTPADISFTHRLLTHFPQPQTVVWNSCLKSLAESGSPFDAILLFRRLRELDVVPNSFDLRFCSQSLHAWLDDKTGKIIVMALGQEKGKEIGRIEKLGLKGQELGLSRGNWEKMSRKHLMQSHEGNEALVTNPNDVVAAYPSNGNVSSVEGTDQPNTLGLEDMGRWKQDPSMSAKEDKEQN